MSLDLASYLDERRRLIDERLAGYPEAEHRVPPELAEAMRYSLLAPGKRLRPILVLMATEACGGEIDDALPAACAVEMVHTYSLVHDDLPAMDDDDMRRGQPACHKKFGEATAILVGDGLLTLAFQVLCTEIRPQTLAAVCASELSRAAGVYGMVGGQMDDLAWERRTDKSVSPTVEDLEAVHKRKTGALFLAAVRIGAMIGKETHGFPGAPGLSALEHFAKCFGLAFQISDDLLDIEGKREQAGKGVQKDAERGKLTYPRLLGVAESRRRLQELCKQATEALTPLGGAGQYLAGLPKLILERER